MDLTFKTSLNSRAPLSERLPRSKKASVAGGGSGAPCAARETTRLVRTTYQRDYQPEPAHTSTHAADAVVTAAAHDTASWGSPNAVGDPSASQHQSSTACHAPRYEDEPNSNEVDASGTHSHALASGVACNHAAGNAPAGVDDAQGRQGHAPGPVRSKVSEPTIASHPSSAWESQYHAQNAHLEPNRVRNFYSTALKVERVYDSIHGTVVGGNQRSVAILAKRADDPLLRPPTPAYTTVEPTPLSLPGERDKQRLLVNELDRVECTQLLPKAEYKVDFGEAPVSRLPEVHISQEVPVQSKAITKMSTSYDMLRGSPAHTEYRPPGYAGHIPREPRNEQYVANKSEIDARRRYAKSVMTLAEHGDGTDSSVVGNNIKAKNRVGANSRGQRKLNPKKDADVNKTVEGNMLYDALYSTQPQERKMNVRDDKRGASYF